GAALPCRGGWGAARARQGRRRALRAHQGRGTTGGHPDRRAARARTRDLPRGRDRYRDSARALPRGRRDTGLRLLAARSRAGGAEMRACFYWRRGLAGGAGWGRAPAATVSRPQPVGVPTGELVIPLALIAVVVIMVLPLPSLLIDVLLAVSISLALTILLMAM